MSTTTELAELEAAIAEHELADELTDDEVQAIKEAVQGGAELEDAVAMVYGGRETENENEPPADELGEPSADQLRKLENELVRHDKRVREVMGGHVAGFEACEHCGGVGLLPPGPKPQSHTNYKACDTCLGFGRVLTGSQRPGNEDVDCPTCRGRGYLERITESGQPVVPQAPSAAAIAPVPVAPVALEQGDLNGGNGGGEQWGVPAWMGDPNLGSQELVSDVLALVESIRRGDRVYTPRGNPEGYAVRAVEQYEDGTCVIVYSTGRSSSARFGSTMFRTDDVLASLAPLRVGERLRVRRGGLGHPAGPPAARP